MEELLRCWREKSRLFISSLEPPSWDKREGYPHNPRMESILMDGRNESHVFHYLGGGLSGWARMTKNYYSKEGFDRIRQEIKGLKSKGQGKHCQADSRGKGEGRPQGKRRI